MKYILGLLAFAFVSQSVSAQLRCLQCTNCETIPTARPIVTCAFPAPPAPPVTPPPVEGDTTLAIDGNPTPPMIEVPDGPIVPVPPQLFPPIVQEPPVEDRPLPPVIPSAPPAITLTPPTVPTFELDDELIDDLPPNARKRRSANAEAFGSPVFSCFEIRVPVGTATQVHRGCVENGGSTTQTCLRANNNVAAPQDCRICSGQECNSATGLFSSIFLTIAAVFVILRMN